MLEERVTEKDLLTVGGKCALGNTRRHTRTLEDMMLRLSAAVHVRVLLGQGGKHRSLDNLDTSGKDPDYPASG